MERSSKPGGRRARRRRWCEPATGGLSASESCVDEELHIELERDRFYMNDDLSVLAKRHGFSFIDTRGWFCFDNQYPMVIGRTIVYRDTGHITEPYAQELSGPFRIAFRRAISSTNRG